MLKNKQPIPISIRATMQQQQLASARNRRLAQQMENRPSVQAALKLKQVRGWGGGGAACSRERQPPGGVGWESGSGYCVEAASPPPPIPSLSGSFVAHVQLPFSCHRLRGSIPVLLSIGCVGCSQTFPWELLQSASRPLQAWWLLG